MRIVDIRTRTVPISRYADSSISSDGLDTTIVAVVTSETRGGSPVVGFGFSSIGRYAQTGLIGERFAPRLLAAKERDLCGESGDGFDPLLAWECMMRGEKPGGHGERSVAVGTLDMALWDVAAKLAGMPLARLLATRFGGGLLPETVAVYAAGGYPYPDDDLARLAEEVKGLLGRGYTRVKIKIGAHTIAQDAARIECVLALLPNAACLAVDAMNRYQREEALAAADAFSRYGLGWFEDFCDPLDYATHAEVARRYPHPLAAGEALFSAADARNLALYGGLRPNQDVLLFDPAHCYGLAGYLRIVEQMESAGWRRTSFWPHGGHLFALQVAAGLGLGGSESNPEIFQPFGGFADDASVIDGRTSLPSVAGIGFESRARLAELFRSLL